MLLRHKFEKFAELPGAAAPGPHHLAKILLDEGMKADRCLEWLFKTSPQTPYLNKLLSF